MSPSHEGPPVETIPVDPVSRQLEEGIALCLSGGGYRAMLFHLGALWRLNELGYLKRLARVSSVSGGSITAGVLGMNWSTLDFDSDEKANAFGPQVVEPVRQLASKTIDRKAIFGGALFPGSINQKVESSYRDLLFGDATLQDLPDDPPRFVINATNVQSGALWRFMKPYMRDWRVGEVKRPAVSLARAVAASSAFPPVLSPADVELDESEYTPGSGEELQTPPFTTDVVLTDGGVYDNLGLETAYKRYKTILVSDGGGRMAPDGDPKRDWIGHTLRVMSLIDNQVRSLRKRQLIASYVRGDREGAYWGIRTDITHYDLDDALDCPHDRTLALANTKTRLKRLGDHRQERLVNWGFAVCDAALRAHVDPDLQPPIGFPYPDAGV